MRRRRLLAIFVALLVGGGIAAGKSEALRALDRIGAATLSSDAVVHELLTTGEVRDALVERFGDDEQRKWLEGLLWPRVGERMAAWREEQEHADPRPRAAVVEVPLLFESGMEAAFDKTIAIVADEGTRSERAGARGHRGVESRTSRQLGQDEKARRADVVVRNDGSLDDLERALSSALATMEP